tara:strand:+ start:59 stop:502 length:444 start_codon:yes stop_codon:yes gene_type:complete
MSVGYKVFETLGVLYVRFEGTHTTRIIDQLLPLYRKDDAVRPGLISLLDCARVTDAKLDVDARLKQMEALCELLSDPQRDWHVAYYCPTKLSRSLTDMQRMLWSRWQGVRFETIESKMGLAGYLGQPLSVIEDMLNCEVIPAPRPKP